MTKIIVPYSDREIVERLGAKKLNSCCYSIPPTGNVQDFHYWNRPPLNPIINGEDRTFGKSQLYIDLIPATSWFTNVRAYVDAVDWKRIKEVCKTRVGHKCELCNTHPNFAEKNYLECYERFLYDKDTKTQTLVRFICVYSKCHQVIHFGLSQIEGRSKEATTHLMKVNRWDEKRTLKHISNRFNLWNIKSKISWQLDLSMLKNMNLPSFKFEKGIV